jgi:hypothetical protein
MTMRSVAYVENTEPQIQADFDIDIISTTERSRVQQTDEGNSFIKGIIWASLISIPAWAMIIGLFVWLF